MGWFIAAAVLALLSCFPLGVGIHYDVNGFRVCVIAWMIRYSVYPFPQKKKRNNSPPKEKAAGDAIPKRADAPKHGSTKKSSSAKKAETKHVPSKMHDKENAVNPSKPESTLSKVSDTKGGSLADFLPFVRLGLGFLNDFRKKIRMDRLNLKLILAGDDPCDLAVNYGRAWAALDGALPVLERVFVIKKRDVEVECDFCTAETTVTAHLDLTITVGRAVLLCTVYGLRALKEYLKFKKNRKGGVTV